MKRFLVGLVIAASACGGSSDLNVAEAAGLDDAASLEIEFGTDQDTRQWITVTDADLVASLAGAVDTGLVLEERSSCTEVYRLRFFRTDGTVVEMDYACPEAPVLWGEDGYWKGRQVVAPDAFADVIRNHLSLAGR